MANWPIFGHFHYFSLSRPPHILPGLYRGRALKTNNSKNLTLEDVAIAKFLMENATHSSVVEGSESFRFVEQNLLKSRPARSNKRGSAYENLAQNLLRKAGLTTGRLSIG